MRRKRRRERTVFDGIEPDENLLPRTIEVDEFLIAAWKAAWEIDLAKLDEDIADAMRCRAAHVKNLSAARRKLKSK